MNTTAEDIERIVNGRDGHPHRILGMHRSEGASSGLVARAWLPGAVQCTLIDATNEATSYSMQCLDEAGFFEVLIDDLKDPFLYKLKVCYEGEKELLLYDPYQFLPSIQEDTLYLINNGEDHLIYDHLGAHKKQLMGVDGVAFTVWAPFAQYVSVVGEFNDWDAMCHPMRSMGSTGVWELFIPAVECGQKYKFHLISPSGEALLKADPYAKYCESPPHNASIVWEYNDYEWGDTAWMQRRSEKNWRNAPISVYEVHMGSWKRVVGEGSRPLTYREMAAELVPYVKDMGFTHVEFMPLAEYPYEGSWGYQVTGFYAPTHRYGTPQDFMYLVDQLHQNDIGILVDWVPGHFPRDTFALAWFDGTHLYNHQDPRQGEHQDWGTFIFNYGRNEVANFLKGSALAWLSRFHIDGFRVDAVASMLYLDYSRDDGQWVANQYGGNENLEAISFLRETNELIHKQYPGVLTIAEESTAWGGVSEPVESGGLGFDFKWNMGWMHDTLEYFSKDPIHRKWEHNQLTFGMLYQYSEHFMLVYSHDEVVHGKGSMLTKMESGSIEEKARTLRALYGFMWGWPGKKTLFMGNEFGQSAEWNYDQSLDWHLLEYMDHKGLQCLVKELNACYQKYTFLSEHEMDPEGFRWIDSHDAENSVVVMARLGDGDSCLLVVSHFTPLARHDFRIAVPFPGVYREVLNTNSGLYGGDNWGNAGEVRSEAVAWKSHDNSMTINLPGLTTMYFLLDNS